MFRYATILIAAVAGLAVAQQAPAMESMSIAPGRIGPVRHDWKQADLLASGLPFERKVTNHEGDEIYLYVIRLDGTNTVEMRFVPDGRGYSMETRSPAFRTLEGAHAGSTIAELRALYPRGHIFKEVNDGPNLIFFPEWPGRANEPFIAFDFAADGLSIDCIRDNKGCPDLGPQRSRSVRTGW
ncbi:MAG TPA: hypothetical protein VGO52_00715 [Hyphomonadaceae bacterium]|jgi:hypothetical protein|nr:hypothetical protein [Hyphomonadaceae bacterium]